MGDFAVNAHSVDEIARKQLLHLAKCAFTGQQVDLALFEPGVDWSLVLNLAKKQTIMGPVFSVIEKLPQHLQPSRKQILLIHQSISLNRIYRAHHIDVLDKVQIALKEGGVQRPVLLKGLGVGLCYPDPTLRQCGDIDIYVGEKDYEKTKQIVAQKLNIQKIESHAMHHFEFQFMDTQIEIHRYPTAPYNITFGRKEFLAWTVDQLEGESLRQVDIEGVKVLLPSYNFDMVFLFFHGWKHLLVGGVGLRQVCDWRCFIDAYSEHFDPEQIKPILKATKLETPMAMFASIIVNELGLDASKLANICSCKDKNYPRVLDKIWAGGNFGFYRKERRNRPKNVFQRKFKSFRSQFNDMRFMFSIDKWYAIKFYVPMFSYSSWQAIKNFGKLGDKL